MEPSKLDETLMLKFKPDSYNGATFLHESYPQNPEDFEKMLKYTIDHLRSVKTRGLWLKIKIEQSNLIPIAVKYGFVFHHSKPTHVMMTHWLSIEEMNKIPHYASHYIGVGGIVINKEKKEILVIQERVFHTENIWKPPGGLVDQGEFIPEAVEREIFEETGIKTKFQSLVAFREKKRHLFGQPDIYFLALCKPLTFEINADPQEIKKAKWMPAEEFLALPLVYELQKRIHTILKACLKLSTETEIKLQSDDDLMDIIGFQGDTYVTDTRSATALDGAKKDPDNMVFYSKVIRDLKLNDPKL